MGLEHTLSAQPWGRDKEGSRQPTVPLCIPNILSVFGTQQVSKKCWFTCVHFILQFINVQ